MPALTPPPSPRPRSGPRPTSSAGQSPLDRYLTRPGATTAQLTRHLEHTAASALPWAGIAATTTAFVIVAAVGVRRRALTRAMNDGARLIQVLTPPEVEPGSAQAFWTNLMALLRPPAARLVRGQPHLAFELTATPTGLGIGLWVPGTVPPGMVERAVHAAWPGARTTTTPATPPLPPPDGGGAATGGQLRLAYPECYPLRTEHPADPLRPLIGALTDLGPDETACVQVLARPVTGRRIRRLHRAAVARRTGTPTTRAAKALDVFSPGTARRPAGGAASADPARAADVAAILGKAGQPCWAVAIHYATTTTATTAGTGPGAEPLTRQQQAAVVGRLRGRAHGIASAFALFTGRNALSRSTLRHPVRVLAGRRLGRGQLLSVPELAAVAHLPGDVAVPGLTRAGARAVPPPPQVGATGKVLGEGEGTAARTVALAPADARQHLHILGATGSGKSTLLTNLILGDISAGHGVVVIDPKGDLIVDLLDRIPTPAAHRVVLIDPDEAASPPVLNVLEGADPDLTVDNLVGIFATIFSRFWGPRTDDVLRSACLTLLAHGRRTGRQPSLADVPRLLSDHRFRHAATANLGDPAGLGGFWDWYEGLGDAARAQAVGPLLNKLRAFLLRDFVRSVVGSGASSFDMAAVLDGGICLVRVPKGILGEDTSRLLGSFVVARVWQAAAHRARLGQAVRVDAALYVDECQNFLTLPRSFEEMLAEARGYRLSLALAHQHLGQLPRELREAVSANARSKVLLRLPRRRPHPGTARRPGAVRARPRAPARLHRRRPPARRRGGDRRVHRPDPPSAPPRPGRRGNRARPGAGGARTQPSPAGHTPARGSGPAPDGTEPPPHPRHRRRGQRQRSRAGPQTSWGVRSAIRSGIRAGIPLLPDPRTSRRSPGHGPHGGIRRDGGLVGGVGMNTADTALAGRANNRTTRPRGGSRDQQLLQLAGRLTDRDRYLCRILAAHRVLTTEQITDIGFTGARRTRKRLAELHHLQLLDRFRPRARTGSAPHHWVLGPAGADLLAAENGHHPGRTGWRLDTAAALARSQRLTHLVGVNGTFTSLIAAARRTPGAHLLEWWSEARCAAEWGAVVRPDGYGVWAQDGGLLPFLLEYDTGSERIARLSDKLTGYADLAREAGHPTWVCFTFPTPGREAAARPALAHRTVPVATAVLKPGQDPAGAVWLPAGHAGGRLRLIDLGQPQQGGSGR